MNVATVDVNRYQNSDVNDTTVGVGLCANGDIATLRAENHSSDATLLASNGAAVLLTLGASNLESCFKRPENIKRVANRPDGNLGLGNRYRLNEASFYLYHLCEMEGAERVANLFPDPRDSFRRAIDAAADANRLSARTDWTSVRSRIHDGPVVPPTDGRRYWFGIARGLRKAKQLMIDG